MPLAVISSIAFFGQGFEILADQSFVFGQISVVLHVQYPLTQAFRQVAPDLLQNHLSFCSFAGRGLSLGRLSGRFLTVLASAIGCGLICSGGLLRLVGRLLF